MAAWDWLTVEPSQVLGIMNQRMKGLAAFLRLVPSYPIQTGEVGVKDTSVPYGTVERYGARGNATTAGAGLDDTDAIQNAGDSAIALGVPLQFTAGKTYRCTEASWTGDSLHVIGYGATLIQGADAVALTLTGGWSDIENVSAFSTVTKDLGDGTTTQVTRVTCSTMPAVAVGDFVKIVSDDKLTGTRTDGGSNEYRKGEYAEVAELDAGNNYVFLRGLLQDTYTTAPRIGVLADVSFAIEGLAFDYDDAGDAAGWTAHVLEMAAAHSCRLNDLTARRVLSRLIRMVGVKGYTANNVRVANAINDAASERYGLGIDDCSSEDAMIVNLYGTDCRHAITTSIDPISSGSVNLHKFGPSRGGVVNGGQGVGCSAAPFDTHLGSRDWTFQNCRGVRTYAGNDSSGAAFTVRGYGHRFVNCLSDNSRIGFYIQDEGITGGTDEVTLVDCVSTTSQRIAVLIDATDARVTIDGGRYEGSAIDTQSPLNVQNGSILTLKGGARVTREIAAQNLINLDTEAALVFEDATFELNGFASGQIVRMASVDTEMSGGPVHVYSEGVTMNSMFAPASATMGIVNLHDVTIDDTPTAMFAAGFQSVLYQEGGNLVGTGDPEGVYTAPVGKLFRRTDGGSGTTLYVKESGTGNTGWSAAA